MSGDNGGVFGFLGEVALNIAGFAVTYAFTTAISKCRYDSNSLKKIKEAKNVSIFDLRSFLDESKQGENLVLVRGSVELKPTNSLTVKPDVLIHWGSNTAGVMFQETYAYTDMPEYKTVPFVLYGSDSSYLDVNLSGSNQPLPLKTIVPFNGWTEEKMLLLGKEITAVGICSLQEGNPQIRADTEIHYFLSDMTKTEMVKDAQDKVIESYIYAAVLGYMSIGVLRYIFIRNRRRWRKWKQQSRNSSGRRLWKRCKDEIQNGGGIAAYIPYLAFLIGLWYHTVP